MKKKILINGSDGMLASDFINTISTDHNYEIIGLNRNDLDIANREAVKEAITQIKPDVILHSAAITNVDYCEGKIQEAIRVNGYGTENLAYYSQKVNSTFVYISSGGLFGDEIKAYAEHDDVQLKTNYAKSKYMGEEKTKEWCDKYFIIRPGWLYGGLKNHKKNFIYQRYIEALNCQDMISDIGKFGCPTYTTHLSQKIIQLLDSDAYGVYHISNSGSANRYEYVKKIISTFGLNINIIPKESSFFKRKAPVPNCEILDNLNLKIKGFDLLPDWESALEEYIYILKRDLGDIQ